MEYHYVCTYIGNDNTDMEIVSLPWESLQHVELVETETGGHCKEATYVKACWDDNTLYFHFHCVDSYIRSDYSNHDDPLYEQDVVELFIAEALTGLRYLELEISPHNVVFDAMIENDGEGKVTKTELEWDTDGLVTEVIKSEGTLDYYVAIPLHNFGTEFVHGKQLSVNFYRIDENPLGVREYQAWSPTGAIQYHIPKRFGLMTLQ